MLKMASVASSGEEYSMYAKPRIEPSAMVSLSNPRPPRTKLGSKSRQHGHR